MAQPGPHRRQRAAYRLHMLLRFAIKTGGLPPGMPLEEHAIMDGFGFSRASARQALSGLAEDGLVERKTGVGTVVRLRPVPIALLDVVPLENDQRIALRLTDTYPLGNSRYVGMRLGNLPAEDVVMSEFSLSVAGVPIGILSAFTVGKIPGASLLRPAWDMPSLAQAFPVQYGVAFDRMDVAIDARRADPELAQLLGIAVGDPILAREQTLLGDDGRAWEYGFAQYRADRVVFRSSTAGQSVEYDGPLASWLDEFNDLRA